MKKCIIFIFLIIWVSFVFAQVTPEKDYPVTISKPYKVVNSFLKTYFASKDEVMAIKVYQGEIFIQKFNTDKMEQISSNTYNDLPNEYIPEGVKKINDRYYFFYSLRDMASQMEQLYVREVDFASGTLKEEGRMLVKFSAIVRSPSALEGSSKWGFEQLSRFKFHTSLDKSKIVIQYKPYPYIIEAGMGNKGYNFNLSAFDNNLKELWSKSIKMSQIKGNVQTEGYAFDSKGNSFLLARIVTEANPESEEKERKFKNHIELFRIKAETDIVTRLPIEVSGVSIAKIKMYQGPNDQIICAGFYQKSGDFSNADGLFMFKAEPEGDISDFQKFEIPVEILNQYENARHQKNNEEDDEAGKAEFEDLELRELIVQEDGNIILIGEQHYIVTTESSGNFEQGGTTPGSITSSHYYNDMLISKISDDGKLVWMRKLPKRQKEVNWIGGGASFKYINPAGDHLLLFLDNVKNMTLPLNKTPAPHKDAMGGYLTGYRVNDETGKVTKISFFDTKNINKMKVYQFNINRIFSISPEEFIVEVYKKKKEDVFIKVGLKK